MRATCPTRPSRNTSAVSSNLNSSTVLEIQSPWWLRGRSRRLWLWLIRELREISSMLLFARTHHIPLVPCVSHLAVAALDGRPLGLRPSPIHHGGDTITCWSPSHRDHQSICFPVTADPNHPGITLARKTQSFYFLVRETNPLSGSESCRQNCLPSNSARRVTCMPELQLPAEYHDLAEAFSKTKATQLPPHRTGDCAIDLQPGSQPSQGENLPAVSTRSGSPMKSYIEEELAKGFLIPRFFSPFCHRWSCSFLAACRLWLA